MATKRSISEMRVITFELMENLKCLATHHGPIGRRLFEDYIVELQGVSKRLTMQIVTLHSLPSAERLSGLGATFWRMRNRRVEAGT